LLLEPRRTEKFYFRVPAVIVAVITLDLILDPGAVAINFWNYGSGLYYGVPVSTI